MDIASILGLIVCAAMVILGIVTGDEGVAALGNFYDRNSVFITIGGTFACTLVFFSLKDF